MAPPHSVMRRQRVAPSQMARLPELSIKDLPRQLRGSRGHLRLSSA